MVTSPTSFSDIQNHWARPFIEALTKRGIFSGFPNGTFQPDRSVTRAQFAAIISAALVKPVKRQYVAFVDVPASYWAANAIQKAYETGFLAGYPDKRFLPDDRIARVSALVSLVSGLELAANLKSDLKPQLSQIYQDAATIPNYGIDEIAIATRAGLVANYPNIKLLNPNLAATRADVAAFIYQALFYLDQVPKIQSNYIVVPPKPLATGDRISVGHKREFRGAWVATVWNSDWPSKPGLPVAQQKAELINIINRLQSLNFNALILQVRPEGDAVYASKLEPWSAWLTGTQGEAPNPFYDPLEFAIGECHKRNIELHAWFNPYRAKTTKASPSVRPHITVTNPDYVYQWGNQLWMDPGAKVVQDKAYNVILDVVRRYDVDGIHLDDYFYPYPIEGQEFPDDGTYADYRASGGNLEQDDWRRENVNTLIRRLATGIRAEKRYVKFGISPFGIYRPGQPEDIRGLDAYDQLYADSQKWLKEGLVDYLAPQLYWRIDPPAQSYRTLLEWWTENNPKNRHIYTGNNLEQLDGKAWKLEEIERQVAISRSYTSRLSLGNIFFSTSAFNENRQGIYDRFKTSVYNQPALAPSMNWLDATPPAFPTGLAVKDGAIAWNTADKKDVRAWTLYKQNGTTWTLRQVFPLTTTVATVEPGTYALCAVDRIGNESMGAIALLA